MQFLNNSAWKYVQLVYGAGIRTHGLQDMSLRP